MLKMLDSNDNQSVGGLVEVFAWLAVAVAALDAIGFCARVLGWI